MNAPSVYLHALGMINALGDDVDDDRAGARRRAARPAWATRCTRASATRFVGRVLAPLDARAARRARALRLPQQPAAARRARADRAGHRSRARALRRASHRRGARHQHVGHRGGRSRVRHHAQAGELPASFNYRQMEIGTAAPFAAAALGLHGPGVHDLDRVHVEREGVRVGAPAAAIAICATRSWWAASIRCAS